MPLPDLPPTAPSGLLRPASAPSRSSLIDAALTDSAAGSAAAPGGRLLLLRAPSGYGKTRAISDWVAHRPADAPPAITRYCSPGDADDLLPELDRILAAVSPGLPVTIVLDDYHHASTPDNDLALPRLTSRTPGLLLIVAARRVHVLDSPISSNRHTVHIIGPEELAFTPAETAELVADPGDDTELNAAMRRAAGWPLAVHAVRGAGPEGPLAALSRFALAHLEVVGDTARRILLAASLLDAIDLDQAAGFACGSCGESRVADAGSPAPHRLAMRDARAGLHQLLELGLLVPAQHGSAVDYRCHPSVGPVFVSRAQRSIDSEERAALLVDRAERIASVAPFTAFKLFCSVERYDRAEPLLAQYFTTITDEAVETSRLLRSLPEPVLSAHTTLCAARLFLERANPEVSSFDVTARLVELLRRALPARRSAAEEASPAMRLTLDMQALAVARMLGDYDRSFAIAKDLDSRLAIAHEHAPSTGEGTPSPAGYAPGPGSFANYYRELALSALTVGDYARARLNWQRLRAHAELQSRSRIPLPPRAEARTVSDTESGRNWLLAAVSGMAFTEMLEGDMGRCAALLEEAVGLAETTGAAAPASTWIPAELARAHLSYERQDDELLQQATVRLAPVIETVEAWQLLLIAQAECARYRLGVHWAHAELRTALQQLPHAVTSPGTSVWHGYLTGYEAMLHTLRGNFSAAAETISSLPEDLPLTQITRARISLFSGDDVGALLCAQAIGDAGLTHWQRIDRSLIAACAAWNCGSREEALAATAVAAADIVRNETPSFLRSVPYDTLAEIGEAARDAGVCDITGMIDAVPEPARCERFERLTTMELRSLVMIAEHTTISRAAAALYVTPATVKKHLNAVYRKLRAGGRQEAILQARRMGLLAEG